MKLKQVQRKNPEAVTKLIDLEKAVEKVQLLEVWSWECASNSQFFCYECCADTLRITERVVVEGSAAAPLQTHTAVLPGSKFNVVLLRLVMQDVHESCFQCEARSQNQYLCGRQQSCTCKQKRQKKQQTRTVFEELKNHANMRTPKLSFDEDGNEGQREVLCDIKLMMKDMKNGCLEEGLGLTCSAEYFGDDVRVIEWKKKEEKLKRQDREDELNDGSDGEYRGFQKTHLSAGTKLV